MDSKGKEKGILKLEPRPRALETRCELAPQVSCDRPPSSPQPSVDRLSVTWADPGSMTSSGVNLFHIPSDTTNNEVKFSPATGDMSEDEDYSVSLSAVLRQRRASVRRSRKGRARRPSSPFLPEENRSRRRSSIFTTSSGDTAISIDETPLVTQEQIFENIHLHKEVLGSVKQQPLGMRRKLKIVHQAKGYIKRHEGQLQERLAQSKSTRDIYARFNIWMATKWQQIKREAANMSNLLIPWELRIKEIESHFGSVVASYFTFLRWLFWVNLVIGFILLVFVIIPECLTANPLQDGERKIIMPEEVQNSTNLLTVWEFDGVLKYSPIFYGYYSNVERPEYRMPLAYFLSGLVVYIYSFVAILRKMAENSRMSKLSEKEDECIFSWKLFTGWDFMIGNTETAHNRIASVILGFKEALLEEAEKKKNLHNWRIVTLRAFVNICVIMLLVISAYAVVTVVSRSGDNSKSHSWWRENETTVVVTVISITFPVFFELLGYLEHYHPRKQLRLQLAKIMLLNLLNLYSLIFALFNKIEGMSKELDSLQPTLNMNASIISENTLDLSESLLNTRPTSCIEIAIPCLPCDLLVSTFKFSKYDKEVCTDTKLISPYVTQTYYGTETPFMMTSYSDDNIKPENLKMYDENETNILINEASTDNSIELANKELERLRNISRLPEASTESDETRSDVYDYDTNNEVFETTGYDETTFSNPYKTKDPLSSSTREYSFTTVEEILFENNSFSLPSHDIETTSTYNINFSTNTTPDSSTVTSMNTRQETETLFSSNDEITTERSMENQNIHISSTASITSDTTIYDNIDNYNVLSEKNKETTISDPSTDITTSPTDNANITAVTSNTFLFGSTSKDLSTSQTEKVYVANSTNKPPVSNCVSVSKCPNITFNCSINCGERNITKVFFISNCSTYDIKCYVNNCDLEMLHRLKLSKLNSTGIDSVYYHDNRKMYNLSKTTQKKLLKLCWETMFGQELVKLTMMDLVFVILTTLSMDFFRALFLRYMNRCWCWDLEKRFPQYGDFKIAENILHLINNQGMVWMGMFFSPGLVVLNIFKLMIMMYLRSWAVMTCNVPHEVVFRVSKSNNFYLALLLTMLFLCVLPVGYSIVWVKPSWHCGPFSEYEKIYHILTNNIYKILPKSLNFALEYMTSPAIVIPLLVLLILIIYYLTSLTNSLREANNDLKVQLRRERTEERRKMFQLADSRRRTGSSAIENTPFSRWKKALPSLPMSKSIDSDDRKALDENKEHNKDTKRKGGILAKIVSLALDKKPAPEITLQNGDDETDTDFHETLPKEILKIKDITITKLADQKKKHCVEFKPSDDDKGTVRSDGRELKNKKTILEKNKGEIESHKDAKSLPASTILNKESNGSREEKITKAFKRKQTSESSTYSKQSDSISSVIPVIMISTTESDEETLKSTKSPQKPEVKKISKNPDKKEELTKSARRSSSDLKSLRRQSSVDSINESKTSKDKKTDNGHKYQYSL